MIDTLFVFNNESFINKMDYNYINNDILTQTAPHMYACCSP